MKTYAVCVLPGDGIGPEVTAAAVAVLTEAGAAHGFALDIDEQPFGGAAIDALGDPFPQGWRRPACAPTRCCSAPSAGLAGSAAARGPRRDLAVAQGARRLREPAPLRRWYAGRHEPAAPGADPGRRPHDRARADGRSLLRRARAHGGGAYDTLGYQEHEIRRILRTGFRLARERRGHLTSVDKANVLESSRLWRELAEEMALEFPDVHLEHQLVDSMAMKLVELPASFDVVVTENLFGDILSDLAAALAGGIGLAPSASLADGGPGIFEPIHGTAPDIAGTGRANPAGACLSVAMLLREIGEAAAADDVEQAVIAVLAAGP